MKNKKELLKDNIVCVHCKSEQCKKSGIVKENQRYKCKDCKRTRVDTDSVKKFSKKAIECGHCKKLDAFKINSYYVAIYGKTKNVYYCNSCNKRTNVITSSKPEFTNKEIMAIDNKLVNYTLAEWRKEYLKRRSEPKKYEDMLYFLDYLSGTGI
jgi:transposase-like protein